MRGLSCDPGMYLGDRGDEEGREGRLEPGIFHCCNGVNTRRENRSKRGLRANRNQILWNLIGDNKDLDFYFSGM